MSERKISSFYCWLLLSLLSHLLLAALVLQQQSTAAAKVPNPVPITVFAINRPTPPAAAEPVKPAKLPPVAQPKPAKLKTTVASQPPKAVRQRKTFSSQAVVTPPAPPVTENTTPVATTDISALLDTVATQAARRELTAAELAALTTPKVEAASAADTAIRRPAAKPGSGPAGDVLETLPDGSQLVRVGKGCVLATPGADLRKDIHSMKIVGCGAGGRTEQDRIDAHFDQVMSSIGQHR